MISILLCNRNEQEQTLISRDCKRQVERNSGEALQIEVASGDNALAAVTEDEKLVNLLYYEFQKGQAVGELRSFRQLYSDTMAMYITDISVSPLEYLRPGISPDSLLLRPLNPKQLVEANTEFMESFFERFDSKDTESCFVVDTRGEKVFIPFSYIYYFEARNKKLFVRAKNEEYAFYDTIESLEKQLPQNFQRCHRSYIINTNKIVRIFSSENYIELADKIGVPLSRSYKSLFTGARQ